MRNKLSLLIILLTVFACKKETEQPPCGCESSSLFSIPNLEISIPAEEQTDGLLFYKKAENIDRFYNFDEYNDRLWILQKTAGCNTCENYYIICNEDFLGADLDFLSKNNSEDTVRIKFYGNAKRTCLGLDFLPVAYSYREIFLTSIEIVN